MRPLLEFTEYVGSSGRNVAASTVAGDAVLLVRCAKQAYLSSGIVHGVTRTAGVGADCRVNADVGLSRDSILRHLVNAARPARERIDLARHRACGIVAGKAELSARTVAHQEVQ